MPLVRRTTTLLMSKSDATQLSRAVMAWTTRCCSTLSARARRAADPLLEQREEAAMAGIADPLAV